MRALPSVEVRDPSDVYSHLLWASSSIETIEISLGNINLSGRIEDPGDLGALRVRVFLDRVRAVPSHIAGRPVRCWYRGAQGLYAFESAVLLIEELDQWWLKVPEVILSSTRRLVERSPVGPEAGFRLWMQRDGRRHAFPVCDLSVSGVGFTFDRAEFPLSRGQLHRAWLQTPAGCVVELRLSMRHTHPVRGESAIFAGGLYLELSRLSRLVIRDALDEWRQREAARTATG